ncbi:MAG: MBOAT family protein, partial [Sphaerospermopsis kisseleviana]
DGCFCFWSIIIVERHLKKMLGNQVIWKFPGVQFILALVTFLLTCLTWVFFRANSFSQAINIISSMLNLSFQTATISISKPSILITVTIIFSMLGIHWLFRNKTIEEIFEKTPWWCVSIILAFMLYAIATVQGEDRSFIYFQF